MADLWTLGLGAVVLVALVALDTVYRKWRSGPKPWLACFLDAVLYPFHAPFTLFGRGTFGTDNGIFACFRAARQATGLSDSAGDGFFRLYEATRRVGLARSRARFSPSGWLIARKTLTKRMASRLQLVEFMKRHPGVGDVGFDATPPIFVVGFPRTGTTFLHELLGLHPSVRQHYSWEQMSPIPGTSDEAPAALEADRQARFRRHRSEFDFIVKLAGESIQVTGTPSSDTKESPQIAEPHPQHLPPMPRGGEHPGHGHSKESPRFAEPQTLNLTPSTYPLCLEGESIQDVCALIFQYKRKSSNR